MKAVIAALLGPPIWIAHFLAVYAAQGFFCPAADRATLFVVIATGIALAVLLIALITHWKKRSNEFLQRLAVPLTVLSIIGVAWSGAPVLLLPACVP